MAPSTPDGSRAKGQFSIQTLHITVGPEKQPFHVHYAVLERTDFFTIHPLPTGQGSGSPTPAPRTPASQSSTPHGRGRTLTPEIIKQEEGIEAGDSRDGGVGPGPTPEKAFLNETNSIPVYHLEGKVYEPAAFEVLVNYLYNSPPTMPASREQCKTLLKAYVLALRYRVEDLQDLIIDCFRSYHREFHVYFEDLIWLVNRVGDDEAGCMVPMVVYLVQQVAFEIAAEGFATFAQNNTFIDIFLVRGDRQLRKVLFEAMAAVARGGAPRDPATGPHHWKIANWPPLQRTAVDQAIRTDVVDLD